MQAVHKTLLEVNEEFLVSEAPASPLINALQNKHVLTDLDLQQLRSLEPQGSRAVKRFVLHVLPQRGPLAFPALLEALQEARAQHLVDLLLEEEAVLNAAVKPVELPARTPPEPLEDPNEYARKLRANMELIESAVDPKHVVPALMQNGVLSTLEERLLLEVKEQQVLTWSVLWGVLMQRGAKAYNAFMGTLLQNGYSALFHTIQETKVTGPEALKSSLTRNTAIAVPNNEAEGDRLTHTRATPTSGHNPSHQGSQNLSRQSFSPRDEPLATSSPLPSIQGNSLRPHASPLQPVYSQRAQRGLSDSSSRPHAGPLKPGYSLGDLDYLYTPRSEEQMKDLGKQDSDHGSRPVDSLYSPTWTDRYNHLRGPEGGSPRPLNRSYTPGLLDQASLRPRRDPDFLLDLNPGSRDENDEGERTVHPLDFDRNFENISESDKKNGIPELGADSDKENHTNLNNITEFSKSQTDQEMQEMVEKGQSSADLPESPRNKPPSPSPSSFKTQPTQDGHPNSEVSQDQHTRTPQE